MPRANRYIIPGGIWHLTHRCHERAHLLRFSRDRERWRHWLFEAVKRHDLTVLTFCITCNHIHLVVRDKEDGSIPRAIPRAMQLLQGRMAQEYNTRKDRTGAYWEDRYHATAVESGTHLLRCLCYVELNMVRAGAVAHPSEWMHCGYREVMDGKQRYRLVDRRALSEVLGLGSTDQLPAFYAANVSEALNTYAATRDPVWTERIAVGTSAFIENVKSQIVSIHGMWNMETREDEDGKGVFTLGEAPSVYGPAYRAVFGA